MPCWPDLWNRIWENRWLAAPAMFLIMVALMLWAPNIRRRWLLILLRVTGGVAASFFVALVCLGLGLAAGMPKPQYFTVRSPRALHQATLMYQAGFLGRDFSRVQVTKTGCCEHFTAYEYAGPSDLRSTRVIWLDDSHLQIQYFADANRRQHCETRVADVLITCTALVVGQN